jgi:hypothetical protein
LTRPIPRKSELWWRKYCHSVLPRASALTWLVRVGVRVGVRVRVRVRVRARVRVRVRT